MLKKILYTTVAVIIGMTYFVVASLRTEQVDASKPYETSVRVRVFRSLLVYVFQIYLLKGKPVR